jgi:hypothetical protein
MKPTFRLGQCQKPLSSRADSHLEDDKYETSLSDSAVRENGQNAR